LKEYEPYLRDVLDRIARIKRHIEGHDYESFCDDGEAIRHVPEALRRKHPDIPWKSIAGMRDKSIHNYLGVDLEYVWNVAFIRIDELESDINEVLQGEQS